MNRIWKCLVAVLVTALLLVSVGNLAGCDRHSGSTWTAMDSGTTARLNGIWGSSSSDVFAVGMDLDSWNGVILHYDGSTWSAMTSGSSSLLHGIWGSSDSDVFAVGLLGTILHYAW